MREKSINNKSESSSELPVLKNLPSQVESTLEKTFKSVDKCIFPNSSSNIQKVFTRKSDL